MIVEKVERPVFTSIDAERRRFRIDDEGLVNILAILRKNMYSNPTRIIVQEYANNARDAHVDAGIPERPIQITCPTSVSPYLRIRDYGNGISPEMIDSVFVAYGASTKRHTNKLIGGFGIGAKSAFSYCDAFEVTTICDGVKYTYAPHIDSSDVGEMPLIYMEDTEEESGTLISIHIREEDLYKVNNAIALVTEYWAVRPEIIGSVNYSNRKVYFTEDNWALMEKSYSYQGDEIIYCVEGIPYTFSIPSDDARFSEDLKELANCPFVVKLKTGDVTIASNREALVSDEKTVNEVYRILNDINTRFRTHVMESITKCETLSEMFELRSMYNRLRLDHMIRSFEWNGLQINGRHLTIPPEIGRVHHIRITKRGNVEGCGYGVKSSSDGENIDFGESGCTSHHIFAVYVEEGKSYNKNQLLNAMLCDNTMMQCQLIILKVKTDDPILNTYGFQYFPWIDLAGYSTKNMWRAKRFGIRSVKAEYYSFTGVQRRANECWTRKFDNIDDLEEGIYFPIIRGKFNVDDHQTFFDRFTDICDLPIYGIPVRSMKDAEDNPNLIPYEFYIETYCRKLISYLYENVDMVEVVALRDGNSFTNTFSRIADFSNYLPDDHVINKWKNFDKLKKDPRYNTVKTAMLRYYYLKNFVNLDESFTATENSLHIAELVKEHYPMLRVFERGAGCYIENDVLYPVICEYVHSVDRKLDIMENH
jgi:hypothetical protein